MSLTTRRQKEKPKNNKTKIVWFSEKLQYQNHLEIKQQETMKFSSPPSSPNRLFLKAYMESNVGEPEHTLVFLKLKFSVIL